MEVRGRSSAVNHRLASVAVILFLWALVIVARLVVLQVAQHSKYVDIAKRQQEEQVAIPAPRGTILDRNGQPLAISLPVSSISVNPRQITDIQMASELLGSFLGLDRNALYTRLATAKEKRRGFVWVKRGMDPFETERLKTLHLAYASIHTESERHYPAGETAAHVLGGLGMLPKEGPEVQGVMGIERGLDKVLRGQDGSESVLMDVHHKGIDSRVDSVEKPGTQLTLTIDARMQYVAERELKAGVLAKHARSGSAIVMNPYTGEILAMANYPTYDPNTRPKQGDDPISRWDLAAQVPFEPGSMFKVITLAAALETTNLKPESMIATGNGVLVLPGRVIHESHHGLGTISMADVLARSSNIGAILIGRQVGREKMYDYARKFGFGQKTGIQLPAESQGILRPTKLWGTTSLESIAMGQEVSVTSLQIARAACVVANGGLMVKPKIVLKRGEKAEPNEAPVRIMQPENAILMRQMMEGVVLYGTGRVHARLNGYTSAGKTGTAQIFDSVTRHYSHNYNASFVGFAPVTNPALVVLVTVHNTSGESGQGSDAAAPVFTAIMTEALRMLDVPHDIPETDIASKPKKKETRYDDVAIAGLGDESIMAEDPSVRKLLEEQMQIVPAATQIANAPAEPAVPAAPAGVAPDVTLQARNTGPMVPDFRGKSMRDAMEEASANGIQVTVEGSGVARAQVPLPGTPLRRGEKIRIVFTR